MTKSSYEKMSMESLHGVDYSTGNIKQDEYPASSETPVLDLSCKKSMTSSPAPEYKKDPSVSPHQSSHYHEAQETNNNDNKHINSYQMHHHHKMENQEIEHSPQNQTHHYPREESPAYSSSTNHERKSPFENRVYIMTPPSESDSPKKSRFRSIYDNSNIQMNETQTHPAYPPMLPMNIPVQLPISVPAVLPTLLSQNNSPVSPMQIPTSSTTHEISQSTQIVAADDSKKLPRPFKAYPKDPLSITLGPDMMFDQDLKKAYSDFRNRMLDSVKRTNEGTNIKMRRVSKSPILTPNPSDEKDAAYWERRRKNNEAAKRSRDARRAKEDEIAIRAAFLEQEYIRLKYENAVLKDENAKIKCLLYGH